MNSFLLTRLLAVVAMIFAVLFVAVPPLFLVDEEVDNYLESNPIALRHFHSKELKESRVAFNAEKNEYVFGRTLVPRFDMNLAPSANYVQAYLQKKEFLWISMTSKQWMVGFAMLQFNYVSIIVVNAYNSETGESLRDSVQIPAVGGLIGPHWIPNNYGGYGPYSSGHRVAFDTHIIPGLSSLVHDTQASILFTGQTIKLSICGSFTKQNSTVLKKPVLYQLEGEFNVPEKYMGLVYPLGPRRAAVVAKIAGAASKRTWQLRVDRETHYFPQGVGAIDYTRGLLRRNTTWHWGSVSVLPGIGMHVSSGTYDVNGVSQESTVFCMGHAEFVDRQVQFIKLSPDADGARHTNWHLKASKYVDLVFEPADGHDGKANYGLVNVNLDHVWGVYTGTIVCEGETHHLHRAPGVLEEHHALW